MEGNKNKRYKVLQVQGGMNKGGVESVIMSWYRNIDTNELQFDFTTCFEEKCPYDDEILERGGNIIYIPPRSKVGNIRHIYSLYNCIKKNGPYEAIHSHMNFHGGVVALAAKIAGNKNIIMHAHNTKDDGNGILRKIEIFILRNILLRLSNQLLACGEEAGKFIYGDNEFKIISNSVDRNIFYPIDKNTDRKLLDIARNYNLKDELIIGVIGRFSTQKNHEFIISIILELIKKNIKFKFVFIGDGELRECFVKEVKRLDLLDKIIMLGLVDNVQEWMNIIDIIVMPSLYEGLPVVVVEAQSSGVKCILSDKITKEVDIGIGLVKFIPIGDEYAGEWANEIIEFSKHKKNLNNELIENALIKKGFSLEKNIELMRNIYLKVK